MKKIYQSPETIFVKVVNTQHLLEASQGGVTSGAAPGDEYTSTDATYSRGNSIWDDED